MKFGELRKKYKLDRDNEMDNLVHLYLMKSLQMKKFSFWIM